MRNRQANVSRFFALPFILIAVPGTVSACPVCFALNDPFALAHPRSIEIALATRAAIEKGHLKVKRLVSQESLVNEGRGWIAIERVPASTMVLALAQKQKGLRRLLDRQHSDVVVHFVFVDTSEACGVELRSDLAMMQAKIGAECNVRIVTTKTALHAILSGTVEFARARQLGVVLIESTGEGITPPKAIAR